MSRFVVTANGDASTLRFRTGPDTNHSQLGTLPLGTEVNSLEVRNVGSGGSLQRWHRITGNQWINKFQSNGAIRNCLPIQSGGTITTSPIVTSSRVRVNASNGLNVRTALIVSGLTLSGSLNHGTTHNWPGGQGAIDPRQPEDSNTRTWIRFGNRRWVSANHVTATS